ncbi:unnamed protein product [Moneuplotes crassus]|uniref:Uncharacterized protein n=1 Tax=Euplotes crassus TaxID=5936 RepID=A0AAD1X8C0_EUPCR|nr:unnamed protein product [Moneuplotes crassus]
MDKRFRSRLVRNYKKKIPCMPRYNLEEEKISQVPLEREQIEQWKEEEYDRLVDSRIQNLRPAKRVFLGCNSYCVKFAKNNPKILAVGDEIGGIHFIDSTNCKEIKDQDHPYSQEDYFKTYYQEVQRAYTEEDPEGKHRPITILPTSSENIHENAIFDIEWFDNDRILGTVCGDFSSRIYDVAHQRVCNILAGHNGSPRTIDSHHCTSDVFVTCGRDGEILLYDVRDQSSRRVEGGEELIYPVHALSHYALKLREEFGNRAKAKYSKHENDKRAITSCKFYDSNTLLSTESSSDEIKFWDLRVLCSLPKVSNSTVVDKDNKKSPKYGEREEKSFRGSLSYYTHLMNIYRGLNEAEFARANGQEVNDTYSNIKEYDLLQCINQRKKENGFTSLTVHRDLGRASRTHKSPLILTNGIKSTVYLYQMDKMSEAPPKIFKSHHSNFYTKATLSPCMDYCITGSDSGHGLLIWNTKKPDLDKFNTYECLDKKSQYIYNYYSFKQGHIKDINGIDWSNSYSQPFIATSSDDLTICLWE